MSVFTTLQQHIQRNGALIVSCQPVPDSPMDSPEIVAAMAAAAAQAGAAALRIEGVANLQAVRPRVTLPIIGIIKRDLDDSPVRITPFLRDVDDLVQAGADIIAFDGTLRPRPEQREALLARIQHHGRLAMADCSSLEDGLYCQHLGCDFIGTTLSGYTNGETPCEPDLALVHALSSAGCRVIAEGRYNTPAQAAQALSQGAWAVTVGSAITRIEHICQWYCQALQAEAHHEYAGH
ncbi:N-acetylmannosamine-6-phosphate 2-epimerase [Edwardsiella piscicida]|uniref:Putative N-acetylmannosamine-6-phosphate 2-epimerase n=3 Tax=Edwardsiella TaxID=635 RepID=A0A0H3DQ60_EDWTF|nr:N-acetylmannosamine-6-phosphate 2-epimerase [Edwardsiella piscicida]ACY83368.1 N-acetylmannosamine-6-phosphate 2-epimerase [Edwardsiella tarda EIB202]ADM40596.1 N-acetylmannosamine-6-phosphate 2-epimerase [Edwardsiella tarda FL6-60]AGH72639.1 N-acetylmannosamine-6-phosphate 2-epimerase [Edwardsiella piscicida C07-087]ARD17828.1 N-acetylmannosamine-6-phosphate 2-epimerase [Edwardsiella piscicida]EKS7779896.1 N-acetylmannosamine-6-phosphate 2-epimerase [Edwardsiella piscicida]